MQIFPGREAFQELEREFPEFDLKSIETCLAFLNAGDGEEGVHEATKKLGSGATSLSDPNWGQDASADYSTT